MHTYRGHENSDVATTPGLNAGQWLSSMGLQPSSTQPVSTMAVGQQLLDRLLHPTSRRLFCFADETPTPTLFGVQYFPARTVRQLAARTIIDAMLNPIPHTLSRSRRRYGRAVTPTLMMTAGLHSETSRGSPSKWSVAMNLSVFSLLSAFP